MLVFEKSHPKQFAKAQAPSDKPLKQAPPHNMLRTEAPRLPEISELETVRHFTRLSQQNFSIDTHFYPLGSCTMKYNPRGANRVANFSGLANRHPLAPTLLSQGYLQLLFNLQRILTEATGMSACSLSPMAGAQGEYAGIAMIKAYHESRNDTDRKEVIVPTAAHGTNPATAKMCGYSVKEIPILDNGDINVDALKEALNDKTAAVMLTNPSTCGVFEQNILEIQKAVHSAGALLYYDGANLNAILGKARPGDMGFDVLHLNLHKTFATPHGGGGPGAGPVAVNDKLKPFLPGPNVVINEDTQAYHWQFADSSIGRLSTFMGNAGVLIRAHFYALVLGQDGFKRVAQYATLNANYLLRKMERIGFTAAYPERFATHEFILSLKDIQKKYGITAMDFAKRLLDYGYHAPTTYFPLLIPECLLIEPTETESKQTLDDFLLACEKIMEEIKTGSEKLKEAPLTLSHSRMDDVKAVKELNVRYAFD
jgi:glycine dehydrogenase subunit 2